MPDSTQLRFAKSLRESAGRNGSSDRYWCVLDREQRGFQVLRVHVDYPGAESLAEAYALKLNEEVGQ